MDIKELMIGNWVYIDEITHYRMQVVNIDENGGVSLDFDGNEGDVFDCNVKDIEPIPVTEEWLKLNDMHKTFYCGDYMVLITEDDKGFKPYLCTVYLQGWGMVGIFNLEFIHELQNGIRLITKQDIELKFE